MIELAVIVWPIWAWFVLTRSDEELEVIGALVCVGCLTLLLLGV